jgi:hypothetical protein
MNPKLCKRLNLPGSSGNHQPRLLNDNLEQQSMRQREGFSQASVRDSAALLLSIADIAKSEIHSDGFSCLWDDGDKPNGLLPSFPTLLSYPSRQSNTNENKHLTLTPRAESLQDYLSLVSSSTSQLSSDEVPPISRVRSVSMDAHDWKDHDRTTSPVVSPASKTILPTLVSPLSVQRRLPFRKQSLRLSSKAKKDCLSDDSDASTQSHASSPKCRAVSFASDAPSATPSSRKKALQGPTPKGVPMKKIFRKKFSWKNYPELEQFLIANREEYLRHSALNYTVQQKQYNNRLTSRLLELASENGYVFDEREFSFVTVRDRIRCYFKSYVQSAKKRGILMGYAARKAGLLSSDDLESNTSGSIVTPATSL